MRKTAESTEK